MGAALARYRRINATALQVNIFKYLEMHCVKSQLVKSYCKHTWANVQQVTGRGEKSIFLNSHFKWLREGDLNCDGLCLMMCVTLTSLNSYVLSVYDFTYEKFT